MAHASTNVHRLERRKHWRDRRGIIDRRCTARNAHDGFDCRSGNPRRRSDIEGECFEAEVWWEEQTPIA